MQPAIEIKEGDRPLFMRYALPCACTLIKRGKVSQPEIDSLIEIVRSNRKIPKGSEKIFAVAFTACSLLALDTKKRKIDKDIILDYYRYKHDSVIDKRYDEMGDFDPKACRIRAGTVEKIERGFALVRNSLGKKKYRADFVPNIREGDRVVTHWDFIVEKTDISTAKKMIRQKKNLGIK